MEQKKPNYAKGIFLTKKISKTGKNYLELSVQFEGETSKYICFESERKDKFGNEVYSVIIKDKFNKNGEEENLPF